MGDGKTREERHRILVEGRPLEKKGRWREKSTDAEGERDKGGAIECEEARGDSETNNNVGMNRREGDGIKTTSTSKALAESMECGERSAEEDSSEGELVSEEDRRSTTRLTVSLSSEVSEEEKIRRQIREDNLKKHRMVRTKNGLKYEVDITEEEKNL